MANFPTPPLSTSPEQKECSPVEPSTAQLNEPDTPSFQTPDTPPLQNADTPSYAIPKLEVPTSFETPLNSLAPSQQITASTGTAVDLSPQSDQATPSVETPLDLPVTPIRTQLDSPAPSEQVVGFIGCLFPSFLFHIPVPISHTGPQQEPSCLCLC